MAIMSSSLGSSLGSNRDLEFVLLPPPTVFDALCVTAAGLAMRSADVTAVGLPVRSADDCLLMIRTERVAGAATGGGGGTVFTLGAAD